jgi:tetratricopeptide (TPR) repeat protein
MINFINSYRANKNWVKAHALMRDQFQSLALLAIRKAVELEPNQKKIPEYLELQGHIESGIGKVDLAVQTFQSAVKIIDENPASFSNVESKDLRRRLYAALEEITSKET